jgi:hypothetical protein
MGRRWSPSVLQNTRSSGPVNQRRSARRASSAAAGVASGTVRGLRDFGDVTSPPLQDAATMTVARSKLT